MLLVRLAAREHRLLRLTQRIVSDGGAMGVLVKEVLARYTAFTRGRESPIEPLAIQCADCACWQDSWLAGDALGAQIDYWKHPLDGAPPLLMLPTDRPRPQVPRHHGATLRFALPAEVIQQLEGLARNGTGKTSLVMLLLGLYEAEHGSIRLNGVTVTPDNLVHCRSHFSAVLADFLLFQQLFEEAHSDTAQRAAQYLDIFDLSHKVRIEDGRFSTIDLSSGQRRRLALISSYLEDRPVYLFDEWAAEQDPTFKRVIAITHDDAYFDCADSCLKLSAGRLVPHSVHGVRAA